MHLIRQRYNASLPSGHLAAHEATFGGHFLDSASISSTDYSLQSGHMPARVVIGVTGHRNLSATLELTDVIRSAVGQIRWMLPSQPNTPACLTIPTPLAEGADRLVAQEVLSLPGSTIRFAAAPD